MNTLASLIVKFFQHYLPNEKGSSVNTIASYRDCLQLLLRFCYTERNIEIENISLSDLNTEVVLAFLKFLEDKRGNSANTRNQRLAVIKCLFRYMAREQADFLDTCQKVCAISTKKTDSKVIQSMSKDEVKSIVSMPNTGTMAGARDQAMLLFMHNTGARVQEVCDLKIGDITLEDAQVLLTGKGKKQRVNPLWDESLKAIRHYLSFREEAKQGESLFLNNKGIHLTRFGVGYIVNKYVKQAALECTTLEQRNITPHIFRHTTALHLIQSGVDIVTVQHWLGHKSIKTTMNYVEIDIEIKRKALELYPAPISSSASQETEWKKPSVMKFLQNLCRHYVQ